MALDSCPGCGRTPHAAGCPHGASATPPASAAMPLDLITLAGMSSLIIDRPVTLGRGKANLLVEHQDVAPTHCRLEPHGEAWIIEDLSGHGVYAGASPVPRAVLGAGEVVDVGGFPGAVALALPCSLGTPIPLTLRTSDGQVTELVLQKLPMVMGRGSWVDLPLADRNVSHMHARLRLERGRVVIDDLQSRNGTFVAGVRVKAGHALRLGDRVRLGETELVFGEAPGSAAPDTRASAEREVKPGPITVETAAGAERPTRVPPARAELPRDDDDGCPVCGESLELRRGGVITGAWQLARTAVGFVGKSPAGRLGRCTTCGVRLAVCPQCGTANTSPALLDDISCRRCDASFSAG